MKMEMSRTAGQVIAGVYGWSISGVAEPEPPRPDPALNRIFRDELVKTMFGGDETTFDAAAKYAFPRPIGRTSRGAPVWLRDSVKQWEIDLKQFVKQLK